MPPRVPRNVIFICVRACFILTGYMYSKAAPDMLTGIKAKLLI